MSKKVKTEWTMSCPWCQAAMEVYLVKNGRRFSAHCFGCGLHQFGPAFLLNRLEHGSHVCPHEPVFVPCKGGYTSWCPLCRVRTFAYKLPNGLTRG